MTAVTKHDFGYLKDILLDRNNYSTNKNHVEVLKLRFEKEINSKRRLCEINTIPQLMEVLQKRDCVSENDITTLEEIAKETGNQHFLAEMILIQANAQDAGKRNLFPTAQRLDPNKEVQFLRGVTNICPVYDKHDVQLRVRDVIATKMGNKWLDFARSLHLMESKIDHLKIVYANNSEMCVREVLDFHKNNVHPRDWKTSLLEALEKARRKDLKNEVNRIFDAFGQYSYD